MPSAGLLPARGRKHHVPGLYGALSARDPGRHPALRTNCASRWQPESMRPWRRHDSACASRPRAQPIGTRSRTPWPASPWLGGSHRLARACCPRRRLADRRRASAGRLQPDAGDGKRAGWLLGNRPVGDDRGPAAGRRLPDRDRRGPDRRAAARARAADPDRPFYSRHRRHSRTGRGPDVAPPRVRGELRRHHGGLASAGGQARAGAAVDRRCPRLRGGDRALRRVVVLAPDRRARRHR